MKLKRALSLLLVFTLVFVCIPRAHAFYDTTGLPAEKAIERWNGYGVILGYDGYFRPDDSITRAEMATIIDRIGSYPAADSNPYRDLGQGWYTEPVLKVSAAGIILGYDGYVRPFDTITRAEAVIMLARAFSIGEDESGIRAFDDADAIPDWAAGFAGAMAYAGVLPFGGTFLQDRAITRAEVVLILDSLLAQVYNTPGVYTENVDGSALISSADVTLQGSTIMGDLYIAGNAGSITLSGTHVMGEIYYMAGQDASTVTREDPTGSQDEPASPVQEPEQPHFTTSDMGADFDLSWTGNQMASLTVYGGQALSRVFSVLEDRDVCDAASLFRFCRETDLSPYYSFLRDTGADKNIILPEEGYILPGTYEFHTGSTPALVMKTFLDAAGETLADYAARASEMGYSLHEILTISSIIEKEVGNTTDPDRATVASVIYNRLEAKNRLQMNVTRNYLDGFPEELDLDTEYYNDYYNTYICAALPVGPICSPRSECVEAALNPYDTDFFFFRSDGYGNIYYAETYDEHLENGQLVATATEYLGYLGGIVDTEEPEEPENPDSLETSLSLGAADDLPDFLREELTDFTGITVMVDPGHGGNDKGANIGSIYEKDINLAVALRVRDILEAAGIQVLMTRTDDTYTSPRERADLANQLQPDLYLSIHCNSTENKPDIFGIETFIYPEDSESGVWASCVQAALIRATGTEDRGVKEGKLIVLHYTDMPSILVEMGFMTNQQELSQMTDSRYQDILARAISDGTFDYLEKR